MLLVTGLTGSRRGMKTKAELPPVRPFLTILVTPPLKIKSHSHFIKSFLTKRNTLSLVNQAEAVFLSLEGKIHISIIKTIFFLNSPIDLCPRTHYQALREEIFLYIEQHFLPKAKLLFNA